ncbi:hypothetical protein L873DRAFT_1804929 [Choiromyces venosus 120613-1]|uniref:Uncharacterized protein n=1 Tax=Choiromyces venosus 120613-1 TaxID=1336337 RepID=A0A3N4JU12_9PEZI|nr:hypothetical protein L873DRAFT_1804929 [Choiromyces venosus 120613-1]
MSKSKGLQLTPYRDDEEEEEEEAGGSSSSAAIPLLIQDEPDHSGEVLPGYYDAVDGPAQVVEGQNGGVRGARRGETEGEADSDAPPEFAVYVPKVKRIKTKLGAGDILTVSHDEHLNTDGEALHRWLLEQSWKPPCVQVRIIGTHNETKRTGNKTERSSVTDFDLTCNFTHLLLEQNSIGVPTLATVPPDQKAHRGHGRFKSVAKDLEEGGTVRDWADQYCEDQSSLKEFVMKKVVIGHDQAYLKQQIERCIRSTNYLGNISIRFPIYDTRVEVHPANRISKLRKTEWFRWIFYITFLWIFAWPYLWFMTKRYHVATMTWRMSRTMQNEDGQTWRESIMSEEEWMAQWGPALKRAAKAGRKSCVSFEDVTAAQAGLSGEAGVRTPTPTGNATVDGALGFLAGVTSIASDFRNSRNEAIGWGGDSDW